MPAPQQPERRPRRQQAHAASRARLQRWGAVLAGLLIAAAGAATVAAGLGWLPRASSNGDGTMAVLVGAVFCLAGAGLLAFGLARRAVPGLALAALLSFVLAFNWVAFGPGERNFSRRTAVASALGAQAVRQQIDAIEGRRVLGAVALVLDLGVLAAGVQWLRRLRGRSPKAD